MTNLPEEQQKNLTNDLYIAQRILLAQCNGIPGTTDDRELATAAVAISVQREAIEKAASDLCNAIADYR